jgi:hypothetical protein
VVSLGSATGTSSSVSQFDRDRTTCSSLPTPPAATSGSAANLQSDSSRAMGGFGTSLADKSNSSVPVDVSLQHGVRGTTHGFGFSSIPPEFRDLPGKHFDPPAGFSLARVSPQSTERRSLFTLARPGENQDASSSTLPASSNPPAENPSGGFKVPLPPQVPSFIRR